MTSVVRSKSERELLATAVSEYERHLDLAVPYLNLRGITVDVAHRFRLGVVSGDVPPEHEDFRGRLVVPYLAPAGPVAIKARCIRHDDCGSVGCVKYLGESDVPPLLYNVMDLNRDDSVLYIAEGELDALILSGELGLPAVGYPGTANWRGYMTRAIGPDWPKVVVVADGDEPGRKAAKEVARKFRGRVVKLPDGHDCTSFFVEFGADALLNLLGVECPSTGSVSSPNRVREQSSLAPSGSVASQWATSTESAPTSPSPPKSSRGWLDGF